MPGGLLVIVLSVGTPRRDVGQPRKGGGFEIGTYPYGEQHRGRLRHPLLLSMAAPTFADAPPPTNGGNGAGQSGQYTGNPDDRPASCGSK